MKYRTQLISLAVASVACSGAFALTKDEYKTQRSSIEASYKAAKKNCDGLKGNAKDICVSEAKGVEKMAKAELEARYKPSDKANFKVNETRADAVYDTAKERCDDLAETQRTFA